MPCIPSACDITITYPVGTATMDTHRTLEKERRDKLILLETVLQSRSQKQLSNVNGIFDRLMTEGCGQIDRLRYSASTVSCREGPSWGRDCYHRLLDEYRRVQESEKRSLNC